MNQKTEDLYGVHPSNDPESYKDQAAFAAHMAHYQNPALYQAFMNTYHRFSLKSWQNLSFYSILRVATVCLNHSRVATGLTIVNAPRLGYIDHDLIT